MGWSSPLPLKSEAALREIRKMMYMSDGDKKELLPKAYSIILLCLVDEMLKKILKEKIVAGLWLNLEKIVHD